MSKRGSRAEGRQRPASLERLRIERVGHRGDGIAHRNGKPVYVPLSLSGETVSAEVSGDRGTLVEIEIRSLERKEPFCPHFGQCGGCQLQHMSDHEYECFKRDLVVLALNRVGLEATVAPLMRAHGVGRRRATFHFDGKNAGFARLRSHQIHSLDHCPILAPDLKDAAEIVTAIGRLTGPCDVALTGTPVGPDVAIRAKRAEPHSGLAKIGRRFGLSRLSLNGEIAFQFEPPFIVMGSAKVRLPVESFLQATAQAETQLAKMVCEAAGDVRHVADLFCGMGPFALRLARTISVHAADANADAIAALQSALRTTSGLKPVTTETRDLFTEPLGVHELNRFDCVVIDPPRAGARQQVEALAQSQVARVISVSCDPASFARDAAILIAGGFRIGLVTPLDQFAHSAHVEIFAQFDR